MFRNASCAMSKTKNSIIFLIKNSELTISFISGNYYTNTEFKTMRIRQNESIYKYSITQCHTFNYNNTKMTYFCRKIVPYRQYILIKTTKKKSNYEKD